MDIFKNELKLEYKDKVFFLEEKKIDEIYSEIINSLIINKKFNNYDFCCGIINQLGLEKIEITKTIFEGLSNILEKPKHNKFYRIKNLDDLINETKINFYYILIKFILKNTFYLYNITFLYHNIMNFKKLLKNKIEINDDNKAKYILIKEKLKEILQFAFDNDYYKKNNIIDENIKINNSYTSKIIENSYNSSQEKNSNFFSPLEKEKKRTDNNRKIDEEQSEFNLEGINFDENEKQIDVQIAKEILTKLKFEMIKTDENYIEYSNIFYGNIKKLRNFEELHKNYNYIDMKYENKDEEKIYNNYQKLINFLEDIDGYVKKSKILQDQMIEIKLVKLEKEEEKKQNKFRKNNEAKYIDIFNITFISSFHYKKIILIENLNLKMRIS